MNPINFPEANTTLLGGDRWDEPVDDLKVFKSHGVIISKWKLTLLERWNALIFGNVWLHVLGDTTYPVGIRAERTPFIKNKEKV